MPDKGLAPPSDVKLRTDRSLARLDRLLSLQQECWEFARGNQYVYRNDENQLIQLSTTASVRGRGKPPHRVRTNRPTVEPFIRQEVSYATQRVPSYEVVPANSDQDVISAAKTAEKVALYGYDKWGVEEATVDAVTSAIVADEGFARAYWNPTVGPVVGQDPDDPNSQLHEGEVEIRTYTSSEVSWEPGVRFHLSPYYVVRQARSRSEVEQEPWYVGGSPLVADATDRRIIGSGKPTENTDLVLVTEYLERPCEKYPRGRRFFLANNRQISQQMDYPLEDTKGNVLDEPCLIKLWVISDPDSDRDHGLVKFALGSVRTYNDAYNKAAEWKNLALNPQVIGPVGTSQGMKLTDVPGAIFEFTRPELVKWREVPPVPPELFDIADRALGEVARLFSQNDIPGQVESGRGIAALLEKDRQARALFIKRLASFHSKLMRHCLSLVARYYTEPRLVKIKGHNGWDTIENFRGADLRDQVDVRVYPSSIEPRTRQGITEQVLGYADRGWISPQQAMSAIEGGTAERLIESYELDVARAHRVVERIFADAEAVLSEPARGDGTPAWMPRPFDRLEVHKSVCEDAMKTERYDMADDATTTMLDLYYEGVLALEAEQAAREAMLQTQMAEAQGMSNAAKDQGVPKPMPDMPSPSTEGPEPMAA